MLARPSRVWSIGFLVALGALGVLQGGCGPRVFVTSSEGGSSTTTGDGGSGATTSSSTSAGPTTCPDSEPLFAGADPCGLEGLHCEYGQECCGGQCYTSYVCDCQNGAFQCYYTDACLPVGCDEGSPDSDADLDGFTELQGDCDDCNPQVNPAAAEVTFDDDPNAPDPPPPPGDEDCDGLIDLADPDLSPCDDALALDSEDPMDGVRAIGVCDMTQGGAFKFVQQARWVLADGSAPGPDVDMARYHLGHGMLAHFGFNDLAPEGAAMLALSSGTARNQSEPGFVSRDFNKEYSSPPPPTFTGATPCPGISVSTESVQDAAGLEIQLVAPSNALAFRFSYHYRTYDFPQRVCTPLADAFWLDFAHAGVTENIAFDAFGNHVGANWAVFKQCDCPPQGPGICDLQLPGPTPAFECEGTSLLDGTDYDGSTNPQPTFDGWSNAGTGWIHEIIPIFPSEPFTLRFVVFDSGVIGPDIQDHGLDSIVTLDGFRWVATASSLGADP